MSPATGAGRPCPLITAMITLAAISSVPSRRISWLSTIFAPPAFSVAVVIVRMSSIRAGCFEIDLHSVNDEHQTFGITLDRQRRLLDAKQAQIIGARPLHEMQVASVIDDAGKVRVLVIDTLYQPVSGIRQLAGKRNQSHAAASVLKIYAGFFFLWQEPNAVLQALSGPVTMFDLITSAIDLKPIPQEIGA